MPSCSTPRASGRRPPFVPAEDPPRRAERPEGRWGGGSRGARKRVADGVIAVPRGAEGASGPVRFAAAGHPVPDIFSLSAAREILSLLERAGKGDLVIALVSGGGSAMLSSPAAGITMEEKAETFRLLLRAGPTSRRSTPCAAPLRGQGGTARPRGAARDRMGAAPVDVPGDDPSVIASGPFSPDPTTYADAIGVLERYGIYYAVPSPVRRHLAKARTAPIRNPETGRPAFLGTTSVLVGTNRTAMDGAALKLARESDAGPTAIVLLPGFLRGEARECARSFCTRLRKAAEALSPGRAVAIVAGGETTVNVAGDGKGGRNQEFALAAALELAGEAAMASWPRERTGSTAHRRRGGIRRRNHRRGAPRPWGSIPSRTWRATTRTRSSRRWETGSSPGRRAPTWPTWSSRGRESPLYQDDVEPLGPVHADRQGELDVRRAAGSRDEGQVRGRGAADRREEIVEVSKIRSRRTIATWWAGSSPA